MYMHVHIYIYTFTCVHIYAIREEEAINLRMYDMICVGEEIGWVWREEGKEESDLIMFQLTFIKTFKK